jgi:LL-diaminopimelate aminotransferase
LKNVTWSNKERRDLVVDGLRSAGLALDVPKAAIYVWAHLPQVKRTPLSSVPVMLDETVSVHHPRIIYGKHGEGFLRVSLGTSTQRIKEAMDRLTTNETLYMF